MITEAIGKEKNQQQNFPSKNCVGNKGIKNSKSIAEHFNTFFTEIGPKLAKVIDPSSVSCENYLKTLNANQSEHDLSINELKNAFFSLKLIKSPTFNEISFNDPYRCCHKSVKPGNPWKTVKFRVSPRKFGQFFEMWGKVREFFCHFKWSKSHLSIYRSFIPILSIFHTVCLYFK